MPHLDIKIGVLTFSYRRLGANEPWIGVVVSGSDGERGTLKLTTDEWNALVAAERFDADREHALAVARRHFIPPTHRQSVAEFQATYDRLAAGNVVPAYDDGPRERLLGEWILVGRPEIEPFIRARVDRPGWLG